MALPDASGPAYDRSVAIWNRIRCMVGKHRWDPVVVEGEHGRQCRVCGSRYFGGAEGYVAEDPKEAFRAGEIPSMSGGGPGDASGGGAGGMGM
jgi:hypothetical protein